MNIVVGWSSFQSPVNLYQTDVMCALQRVYRYVCANTTQRRRDIKNDVRADIVAVDQFGRACKAVSKQFVLFSTVKNCFRLLIESQGVIVVCSSKYLIWQILTRFLVQLPPPLPQPPRDLYPLPLNEKEIKSNSSLKSEVIKGRVLWLTLIKKN